MQKKPASLTEGELSPGLRRYLYFTAALTGAAIMIVEILGAKLLSPYVGTSHFVWTAQIAVTLVALACGYYAGGRLVDRSPKLGWLYWAILGAAFFLSLTVMTCEPVAYACLKLSLPVGSLLASAALFFLPLALLAMTGPFLIRMVTASLATVGGSAGRLSSISTLGSFAGTVLIGYLVIPFLPNSVTMYLTALGLMLVSLGYFFGWGGRKETRAPLVLVAVLGAVLGAGGLRLEQLRHQKMGEIFFGNSNFGQLQVLDTPDGERRYYLNDYLTQNIYDPEEKKSAALFTYMLHGLARVYTTNINDALCIGMGVGIVPMEFAREGVRVDVVEINPAVVPVGEKFFGLEPARLNLTIGDGRQFLNACRKQYDAVVLDAFLGDSCPSHLMTREAFASVRRVLRPGGVLVINSFGGFDAGRDFFTTSLFNTLQAVFPSVRMHTSGNGNFFFVASDRPALEFIHQPNFDLVHDSLKTSVKAAFTGVVEPSRENKSSVVLSLNPDHGRVLTDDFNPVEFHDAKNRESIRKGLAQAMRRWQ